MKPQEADDLECQPHDNQGTGYLEKPPDSDFTEVHWAGLQNFAWLRFAISWAVSWQPLERQDV